MSGIYGIFRFDGAPVDPKWLERMKAAMEYYGPDGAGSVIEGPVGLGHLLLNVNPEDAFERQPMRNLGNLLVCSARLDNRDALLDHFRISAADAPQVSDGHLVGQAFDCWGEELCSHLEGDWSLAAWNAGERRLLLALNPCGNETLYYHAGEGFVAFASSLKALLALPGISKEPDFLRLAEVLISWDPDAELTAYKQFRRLIWARAMTVAADGRIQIRRYWSPEGREPLRYRRDEEYIEGFLDHYERAVRSCLRSTRTITAQLSGGRDSGSVVTMAAPILAGQGRDLTAFTSVPYFSPDGAGKSRLGNEWDLAQETATMAGANVRHVAIDAKNYGVIQGIEHMLNIHDGPGHGAINHYWCQAVFDAAAQAGSSVLLHGLMGNATVSWSGNGSALLALVQGYPTTALRLFQNGESNPWNTLKRQVLKPVLMPARRLLRRLRMPLKNPWRSYSALNVHLAQALDINGRMRDQGFDPTFTGSALLDCRPHFFDPSCSVGVSIDSEIGAWHSFSCVDPTANLSMLEFLLRVPDDQFWRGGDTGSLMKRAFQNKMPSQVLHSRQKGLQAADVGHRIVNEIDTFRQCLRSLESVPAAREALDLPMFGRCLEELTKRVDPESTDRAEAILLRGLGVGLFLQRLEHSGG
jgi:asparagine synthase (glutamine-hydrolysing)